jgi:hypothetical protein
MPNLSGYIGPFQPAYLSGDSIMELQDRSNCCSTATETQKLSFLVVISKVGVAFLLLQLKDIKCNALEKK